MNEHEQRPNIVEAEMTQEDIVALSKKVSLLMTKPENTDRDIPLTSILGEKGLKADGPYEFTLDETTLRNLYPEIDNWNELIQKATREHLLGRKVKVYLIIADNVAGEASSDGARNVINVTDELLKLKGEEKLVHENPEGTLRRKYYGRKIDYFGTSADGHTTYHENGFHGPKTPEELITNLKAFGLLEEAKKLVGME